MRIKDLAKRVTYHALYPAIYRLHAIRPTDSRLMLFVEMNAAEPSNNFTLVMEELKRRGYTCDFVTLKRIGSSGFAYVGACVRMAWKAARSSVIWVCDGSMPVSCLPLRPQSKVVQLWHACGAFKKFGESTADAIFGASQKEREEFPYYANLSLVTVSSPKIIWAYKEAMGLEATPQVVQPLGVSRTDVYFNEDFVRAQKNRMLEAVPKAAGKKVLLYAPTFRGQVTSATAPDGLDLELLRKLLGNDWVVLVKQHPFVRDHNTVPPSCADFAFDVTDDLSIECCMCAADALLTDYSSVVFEYALLRRPMAFFAYDLDDYNDWRGFYYDYDHMTPGPVMQTSKQVAEWVEGLAEGFDPTQVDAFYREFMRSCDGHATQRIVDAVVGPNLGDERTNE